MAYTKRDKNTSESEIFFLKPDKRFKIRFYIIGEVHWQDYKQRKRGENRFSYDKIMHATGASKKQVFGCLEWLRDRGMIRTQKETRGMTVEVLNYAKYQDVIRDKGNRKETERKQKGNTEGDTIEEEEKNKRINNRDKEKEKIFWNTYPHARKGKKQDAIKFAEQIDVDVFLNMVNIYKREVAVGMQDAKYVPACERWARDFVPYSDTMQQTKLKQIYYKLLDDRKVEEIKQFTQDFGEETVMRLYEIRKEEQRKQLLSGMK